MREEDIYNRIIEIIKSYQCLDDTNTINMTDEIISVIEWE